jgi:hypothetical protein
MSVAERALAWAILVLGLAVLWLGLGLPAWRHLDSTRAEIARMTVLAERYETEAARRPSSPDGASDAALLTRAATEAQAQAALQERLKAILAQGGAVLTGLQPQTAQSEGGWRVLPLSAQLTGDIGALQRVLHGLETTRPLIAVEAVQVRARGRPGTAAGLEIALDLAAFAAPSP